MSATALELEDVSAGYGTLRVLHGISLSIATGERVGLVGLNGHGKTTLMRAIVGLTDSRQGEVRIDGRSTARMRPHQLARAGVVMVPQGDELFVGLSVRENLDSGVCASSAWRERRKRRERVLELFPRLRGRLDHPAATLSGGERRMLSIGRGLMMDGSIYLIDEPSLGLAPGIALSLLETLSRLPLERGALLLAEQNAALLEGRTDRILRLHGGELVEPSTSGSAGLLEV
jgi:branched-chain amino acid transport system ATP-binding protein